VLYILSASHIYSLWLYFFIDFYHSHSPSSFIPFFLSSLLCHSLSFLIFFRSSYLYSLIPLLSSFPSVILFSFPSIFLHFLILFRFSDLPSHFPLSLIYSVLPILLSNFLSFSFYTVPPFLFLPSSAFLVRHVEDSATDRKIHDGTFHYWFSRSYSC
jgi:hypothetical protein